MLTITTIVIDIVKILVIQMFNIGSNCNTFYYQNINSEIYRKSYGERFLSEVRN